MVSQSGLAAYLLVWGIISVLVSLDAQDRGENKVLWGVTVFFLSVLGIILYYALVVSPEPKLR
jgi:hypothetical protein